MSNSQRVPNTVDTGQTNRRTDISLRATLIFKSHRLISLLLQHNCCAILIRPASATLQSLCWIQSLSLSLFLSPIRGVVVHRLGIKASRLCRCLLSY